MSTRGRDSRDAAASRQAKVGSTLGELGNLAADREKTGGAPSPRTAAIVQEAAVWRAKQELHSFQGLVTAVTAHLNLRQVVKAILDEAVRVIGAERGLLFLGRQDAGGLVPILAVNLSGQALEKAERVSRTILAAGQAGELVITQDALADARFMDAPSIQANQMRSILCAPLMSPTGQVGAIYLDSTSKDAFPEGTPAQVQGISRVAGTALENARVHGELIRENTRLRATGAPYEPLDRLVGTSERMEVLRRQAAIAAFMEEPILIVGEPGSGRRLLARAIHDTTHRATGSFVACDCSVVPKQLLTGAVLGRIGTALRVSSAEERGWVTEADRGTLYLAAAEELGDDLGRALALMVKHAVVRPLGARKERPANVRLMLGIRPISTRAGEPPPLPETLASVLPDFRLAVPALRERPEDIPALVGHWTRVIMEGVEEAGKIRYTLEALATLQEQPWPGNVRELHQVLHRVLLTRRSNVIDHDHIRRALAAGSATEASTFGPWSGSIRTLQEWEDEAIRQALWQTHDNKAEAARLLGVHRNTLIRKLKMSGRS
jgi:DNA-binding NtrC family response regulator